MGERFFSSEKDALWIALYKSENERRGVIFFFFEKKEFDLITTGKMLIKKGKKKKRGGKCDLKIFISWEKKQRMRIVCFSDPAIIRFYQMVECVVDILVCNGYGE